MTDVLKIALDRRAELHEELSKLDDFIRTAEALIRGAQTSATDETEVISEMPLRPTRMPEPSVRTQIRRHNTEDDADTSTQPHVIRRATSVSGT